MIRITAFFAVIFLLGLSQPQKAAACAQPFKAGEWENIRLETGQISTLEVIYLCKPDADFGQWKVRAKAECAPRDCTWGWVAGRYERDVLSATFETFNNTHKVTLEPDKQRFRAQVITRPRSGATAPITRAHIMIKVFR